MGNHLLCQRHSPHLLAYLPACARLSPQVNTCLVPICHCRLTCLSLPVYLHICFKVQLCLSSEVCPSLISDVGQSLSSEVCPSLSSEVCPSLSSEVCPSLSSEVCPSLSSEVCRLARGGRPAPRCVRVSAPRCVRRPRGESQPRWPAAGGVRTGVTFDIPETADYFRTQKHRRVSSK